MKSGIRNHTGGAGWEASEVEGGRTGTGTGQRMFMHPLSQRTPFPFLHPFPPPPSSPPPTATGLPRRIGVGGSSSSKRESGRATFFSEGNSHFDFQKLHLHRRRSLGNTSTTKEIYRGRPWLRPLRGFPPASPSRAPSSSHNLFLLISSGNANVPRSIRLPQLTSM